MMMRRADARRDAPALRFLIGCVGGWVVLRTMMLWNPAIPAAPPAAPVPWVAPSRLVGTGGVRANVQYAVMPPTSAKPRIFAARANLRIAPLHGGSVATTRAGSGEMMVDRHDLRLALMARLLPSSPRGDVRTAAAFAEPPWRIAAPRGDPAQGEPFWMRRQLSGWSTAAWLYFRDGSGAAPRGIGSSSQLGGSQGGVRLAYGFGAAGRLRAYARATMALERPRQRDAAFGLTFAPLGHLPIDVAIEQRVAAGSEGRTALAAMMSGGVSEVGLPMGFRLDAYAQAGVVGARSRDVFADGSMVIDRGIGREDASLRLGALAAGAVQPGAARVDVGPRLTLRLPDVGQGSRIALDWRQRVAGDARPTSGLALTLASDF
ncbi:hypothetical protein [Sphingopyxis kveilinensis]|uniref:hypothetical protein n=1 Tax=Sphingopyxis kveilinensis TaxID=3114367 RepID=UPI0030CB32B7